MKKTLKASLWLTLAVILSTAGTFQDHGYSVTKLNQNLVHATGINNLGQISGFFQDGGWHGIIITGNNFTIFDLPGHSGRTWVYGINALGQLVGNTDGSSFINTGVDVIPLNVPSDWNGRDTAARGLSNSGQVVGYYTSTVYDYNNHGFLYEAGSFTKVDYPDAPATYPFGINNSSQVVGYYSGFHPSGFIRTGGAFTTLMVPNSSETYASGINNKGQVVGYYLKDSLIHGFLYTGGNYITLDIPGENTYITGINDSGQIVGNASSGPFTAIPSKKSIASIPQLLLAE